MQTLPLLLCGAGSRVGVCVWGAGVDETMMVVSGALKQTPLDSWDDLSALIFPASSSCSHLYIFMKFRVGNSRSLDSLNLLHK